MFHNKEIIHATTNLSSVRCGQGFYSINRGGVFFFSATASTAQMMQNSSTVLEQGTSTQTTTHGKELKFIRTFSVSFC